MLFVVDAEDLLREKAVRDEHADVLRLGCEGAAFPLVDRHDFRLEAAHCLQVPVELVCQILRGRLAAVDLDGLLADDVGLRTGREDLESWLVVGPGLGEDGLVPEGVVGLAFRDRAEGLDAPVAAVDLVVRPGNAPEHAVVLARQRGQPLALVGGHPVSFAVGVTKGNLVVSAVAADRCNRLRAAEDCPGKRLLLGERLAARGHGEGEELCDLWRGVG